MRLRSSQFVFLLLLVCSVQTREQYARHLMAGTISGASSHEIQQRDIAAAVAQRKDPASPSLGRPTLVTRLDSASLAAETTPWSMRRPALESAAVVSFTGFLRA